MNEIEFWTFTKPTAWILYHCALEEKIFYSSRPVILAGAGCLDCADKFRTFVETHSVPVLLTWKAMELLADDHPLYAGRPGAIGQVAANRIIQECDLLLVLGAAMNYDQVAYHIENIAPEAVKIVVDVDAVELQKCPENWIKIHADVAEIL